MARLIDADEALLRNDKMKNRSDVFRSYAKVVIDGTPTIDAIPVVHGRWEPVDHDGSWRVDMCSVCHRRMHYVDYDQPYQYCPNCGADMRERSEGE